MSNREENEALFWCNLLAPLIFDEIENGNKTNFLEELASQEYILPDGSSKRVSVSTLKRKLKKYREEGFQGLQRKLRSDKGQIRSVSPEVLTSAIAIKKDQPNRSDEAINNILEEIHGVRIKRSTLLRHLRKAGATRRKLGISKKPVRKRWSREKTNALWSGDFAYGPMVVEDGQPKKTYLSAFVDSYSRVAVAARYYYEQSLDILVDTLLRAWNIHGASLQIYVDNGKVYHANSLEKACFELGIKLMHRPVRDPAAGGLIERFIFTVQRSFESEIRASSPVTLAELNQKFSAWLEVHYHQSIHSEIGQTPKQQYQQGLEIIRRVDLPKVLPLFMNRYDRTVDHNYSDVRVKNSFYRVDPKFRGDRVCVLINPFDNKDHALIYSKDDVFLGQGILYHREYGQKIEPYQQDRTRFDYLGLLQKKHQQQLDQGIDYSKLHYRKWPFDSLLQTLSHYLGRKGGVSAFTSYEHEILWDLWQHQHFCESLVITAWQNSFPKNFNCFIAEFRNLLQQKEI